MANETTQSGGGLVGAFDKAHGKMIKILSLKGYLFSLVILPTVAVAAANPSLLGIGAEFAQFAGSNMTQNFIPGWQTIGEATANAFGSAGAFISGGPA